MSVGSVLRDIAVTSGVVGDKVYLDNAPKRTAPPYVTYNDTTTSTPALGGDGKQLMYERQLTFDLWLEDTDDEDVSLVMRLRSAFNGARVKVSQSFTSTVRVISVDRQPGEFDNNLTHYEIVVALMHDDSAL